MGPAGTADINKAMTKLTTQTKLHHAKAQTFNQDACITGLIKEIMPAECSTDQRTD
jgi:hypothetical protein